MKQKELYKTAIYCRLSLGVGMRIASNHILKGIVNNPESVQQYRLWQLKTYGKYTT